MYAKSTLIGMAVIIILLTLGSPGARFSGRGASTATAHRKVKSDMINEELNREELSRATLAGGCFWCMEPPFITLDGVEEVIAGYTGGEMEDPSYEEVSSGETGHYEAVEIYYDPEKISFAEILDVYWRHIDPTDRGGQFADRGPQYETAIFYHGEEQKKTAERSRGKLESSGKFDEPIATEILPAEEFYPAERYHQDYYQKNPVHYESYKELSGREGFIEQVWAEEEDGPEGDEKYEEFEKPSQEELRRELTDLQYNVTQEKGTEPAFHNEYWDNEEEGIYVDVVSGEPLFSSTNKFESGSGWPSFTRPLEPSLIREAKDTSSGTVRTEVRSRYADSHLGHVFDDGPKPTGRRYCINSAALEFIPVTELEERGYGEYLELFESD